MDTRLQLPRLHSYSADTTHSLDSLDQPDEEADSIDLSSRSQRPITAEVALGAHSRVWEGGAAAPPAALLGLMFKKWPRIEVGGRAYGAGALAMAESSRPFDTGFVENPFGDRWDFFLALRIEAVPFLNLSIPIGLGVSMHRLFDPGDFEQLKKSGFYPAALVGASIEFSPLFLHWALTVSTADVSSFTTAKGNGSDLHYFLLGVRLVL